MTDDELLDFDYTSPANSSLSKHERCLTGGTVGQMAMGSVPTAFRASSGACNRKLEGKL
jgi:hypothetical protein